MELRWENVTVTAGKGDESKTILSDVTGRVKQGMVTDLYESYHMTHYYDSFQCIEVILTYKRIINGHHG